MDINPSDLTDSPDTPSFVLDVDHEEGSLSPLARATSSETCAVLHIAKLSKTSSNGSLLGFSALLVMTFYLVLVTDNVHSTSRPLCSDLLCHIFNMYIGNVSPSAMFWQSLQ